MSCICKDKDSLFLSKVWKILKIFLTADINRPDDSIFIAILSFKSLLLRPYIVAAAIFAIASITDYLDISWQ